MAKQSVSDLREGSPVDSYFSVKYKKSAREYKYGWMFEFRVADASGEMTAKYWGRGKDDTARILGSFEAGDVVAVRGTVSEFNGSLEISLSPEDGGRVQVLPSGKYDAMELVGKSPVEPSEMLAEALSLAKTIKEPNLAKLVRAFFDDPTWSKQFAESPASMMLHSNYVGGLIEHSLKVARICDYAASLYATIDRDLLVAGALLHDIGKMREFSVTSNIDVSEEGMLRGHILIGEEMVNERIAKIDGFPELLKLKLDHMLLAHHGKKEWGSPKEPQTPEALLLHLADMIDSQVFQYLRARDGASTDDPWIYDKRLGHIFLK